MKTRKRSKGAVAYERGRLPEVPVAVECQFHIAQYNPSPSDELSIGRYAGGGENGINAPCVNSRKLGVQVIKFLT